MRYFGRLLTTLTSLLLMALIAAAPASAAYRIGTPAWSAQPLVLYVRPGTGYAVTGEIAPDLAIRVLRCQKLWCVVDGPGGHGWTYKHGISFGTTSTPWPRRITAN